MDYSKLTSRRCVVHCKNHNKYKEMSEKIVVVCEHIEFKPVIEQKLQAQPLGYKRQGNTYMNEVKFTDVEKPSFDLKGYSKAVRAISIAVAGKLNILAYGAPGCGDRKSTRLNSSHS